MFKKLKNIRGKEEEGKMIPIQQPIRRLSTGLYLHGIQQSSYFGSAWSRQISPRPCLPIYSILHKSLITFTAISATTTIQKTALVPQTYGARRLSGNFIALSTGLLHNSNIKGRGHQLNTFARGFRSSVALRRDPYKLLGVATTATDKEIKLAYFKKANKS